MNTNIWIFSQNIILESFAQFSDLGRDSNNIFVTPHKLLDHEKIILNGFFSDCIFMTFADYLTDKEMALCDEKSYNKSLSLPKYYQRIKAMKNGIVCGKVIQQYAHARKYVLSNDLGIDQKTWLKHGFKQLQGEYYYVSEKESLWDKLILGIKQIKPLRMFVRKYIKHNLNNVTDEVYSGYYNDQKYVFIGSLNRIGYRTSIEWSVDKDIRERIKKGDYPTECQYLSTLHESSKCLVPDKPEFDVRYIQDGYLPPNYTSKYLFFKPKNVSYYAWDKLGAQLFLNQGLPVEVMPFRKRLYLPDPIFSSEVKTILVATSGPGDWTAIKNRSDEDLMLLAFVELARRIPNINIIYRCHPTWVHPEHNGVNSIKRVAEYIKYTGLKNIFLSTNIPMECLDNFVLSFERSSLEEDLKKADMVFGEHSISMIDAGFKQIPFCSVNLTGRRNLFTGITEFGFPHCETVEEIAEIINNYKTSDFQSNYHNAIQRYNQMTNAELQ